MSNEVKPLTLEYFILPKVGPKFSEFETLTSMLELKTATVLHTKVEEVYVCLSLAESLLHLLHTKAKEKMVQWDGEKIRDVGAQLTDLDQRLQLGSDMLILQENVLFCKQVILEAIPIIKRVWMLCA